MAHDPSNDTPTMTQIKARHVPCHDKGWNDCHRAGHRDHSALCEWCGSTWPCDALTVLQEVERLTKLLDAKLDCGHPIACEIEVEDYTDPENVKGGLVCLWCVGIFIYHEAWDNSARRSPRNIQTGH